MAESPNLSLPGSEPGPSSRERRPGGVRTAFLSRFGISAKLSALAAVTIIAFAGVLAVAFSGVGNLSNSVSELKTLESGLIAQSIALEGIPYNVFTTAVCPGFTYSEFHDVNGMRGRMSRMPAFMWMDADTVARQGYDAVMRGKMVYVNGRVNRAIAYLSRVMPQWIVMMAVKRTAGTFRRT